MSSTSPLFFNKHDRKEIQNYKILSPNIKKYSDNLNTNIVEFKQQKDLNNRFLFLYKKYIAHQKKVKKKINNNGNPFDELFNQYKKCNHPYPRNALKGNIFKNDPLLMIKAKELEDYSRKDLRKDIMNEYLNDKSITKLNHIEYLAIKRAKQLAEASNSPLNYFDIINKRLPYENKQDKQNDRRDMSKLNKEKKALQRDIMLFNDLMSDTVYDNIDLRNINEYIIRPKQSIVEEPNNIIRHFRQSNKLPNKVMKTSASTSQFDAIMTNQQKPGKSKTNMTLSTSCLSPNKFVRTNSGIIHRFIPKLNQKAQWRSMKSVKGITASNKEKSKNSTFSSTFQLKNQNEKPKRLSSGNSYQKNDQNTTPEALKSREMEFLYHKLAKENIFNKHRNIDDTLNRLSSYFDETLKPKNNLNEMLSSFSAIQDKVKKFDIAGTMKKLYSDSIPLRTAECLERVQKADSSISVSKETVMKEILEFHI